MDIESQFSLTDDPDGQLARARMAQAYGDDVTRLFFSLLEDTIEMTTDKPYNHPGPVNLSVRVPYNRTITVSLVTPRGLRSRQAGHWNRKSLRLPATSYPMTIPAGELVYAGVPDVAAAVKKAIRDAAAAKLSSGAAIDRFSGALEQGYAENQLVTAAGLEQSIVDSAPGLISYDNARKQLIFAGALMTGTVRQAIGDAAAVVLAGQPAAIDDFDASLEALFTASQAVVEANLEQLIVNAAETG